MYYLICVTMTTDRLSVFYILQSKTNCFLSLQTNRKNKKTSLTTTCHFLSALAFLTWLVAKLILDHMKRLRKGTTKRWSAYPRSDQALLIIYTKTLSCLFVVRRQQACLIPAPTGDQFVCLIKNISEIENY